jgi:uncharacterized protein YjbJ (UPF0337 family)
MKEDPAVVTVVDPELVVVAGPISPGVVTCVSAVPWLFTVVVWVEVLGVVCGVPGAGLSIQPLEVVWFVAPWFAPEPGATVAPVALVALLPEVVLPAPEPEELWAEAVMLSRERAQPTMRAGVFMRKEGYPTLLCRMARRHRAGSGPRARTAPDGRPALGRLRCVISENSSLHFKTNLNYPPMKDSTHDKIEGTAKEVQGKIKEETGDVLNKPRMEAEGAARKVEGQVQKAAGKIEDQQGR